MYRTHSNKAERSHILTPQKKDTNQTGIIILLVKRHRIT